ncbi:SPOR domain-containing protein [Flavobacterium sp. SOK18b]|uniref:Sporulation related protein n=1 Tax=Flavobacterium tiangeerense TaxID=459471 RepID=A0ABY3FMA7_9FLAO|nr:MULTISPECIES: SPOR domain-containing protein [Flavobacterium]MBB1193591.1 SPOR domain-containing protein [Flavobacterium sp. SOK18b]TWI02327.1 hypothetical protein IQ05_00571 [Flavobacterium tiangeerense]
MRILSLKASLIALISTAFFHSKSTAQQQNISIKQDSKFEQLLTEKRKTNQSNTVNDRFKIQIYSGDSEKAKSTLNEFRQEFNDIEGTIVFFAPNYKVWIGNFKSRIEAERHIVAIKKKYPNLNLIRPNK